MLAGALVVLGGCEGSFPSKCPAKWGPGNQSGGLIAGAEQGVPDFICGETTGAPPRACGENSRNCTRTVSKAGSVVY